VQADRNAPPVVVTRDLSKTYEVPVRADAGFAAVLRSLLKRRYEQIEAVRGLNWQVRKGSLHAFLGRNGSGKSTTVKMLAGILKPTSGTVEVLGFKPWEQRSEYVRHIGAVFGHRSQLGWELPAIDTYELHKSIFRIPQARFRDTLGYLSSSFAAEPLIVKPVRNLSLGERMKCELICALLHEPKLVFLDEPTIGLDLMSKDKVRSCIKQINRDLRTTFLITSHDVSDLVNVCEDVSIIHDGELLFDATVEALLGTFAFTKIVTVKLADAIERYDFRGVPIEFTGIYSGQFEIEADPRTLRERLDYHLQGLPVVDISIQPVSIERIVKSFYSSAPRRRAVAGSNPHSVEGPAEVRRRG
jgi:ABC-2 type transport system ATP-binding protein